MAIYYNLGIDCGADESVAVAAMVHFDGFAIDVPGRDAAVCSVARRHARGLWFVEVSPAGLGQGIPHPLPSRPELCDPVTLGLIGAALHARLKSFSGYRRAMFGGEVFDQFVHATPEEDQEIDYAGLIFCRKQFPTVPPGCAVEPFSAGYRIVSDVVRQGAVGLG
jgi:hypothetical protein